MHLCLNALAASAGGGLTYVRNVVPHLAAREDMQVSVVLTSRLRRELGCRPTVHFVEIGGKGGTGRRFWQEQRELPGLIRRIKADVLVSAGNFALWDSPVPQILLSRNALYISNDFRRDLESRGDYALWLDTHFKAELARRSIQQADATVAPTVAFADELASWTGRKVLAIHHGFDGNHFFAQSTPPAQLAGENMGNGQETLRLLFVSHYNYYRNFETLFRGLALLKRQLYPRGVKLVLTCKLESGENPGFYRTDAAASLVRELKLSRDIVQLGAVPYENLYHLYRQCDVYVTPAYAESFAHPLVEAMASGLPVVASDLAVHREICGPAALYFPRFSAGALAKQVACVAGSTGLAESLTREGRQRSTHFSWRNHVAKLTGLAADLLQARGN